MTEALQRQLANDEPKCGNCRFWMRIEATATVGACDLTDNLRWLKDERSSEYWPRIEVFTTDLSVCSKWERKSDGKQTKAEAGQA